METIKSRTSQELEHVRGRGEVCPGKCVVLGTRDADQGMTDLGMLVSNENVGKMEGKKSRKVSQRRR